MAQRGLATLADRPWTKEWLDAAIDLCLSQPDPQPLPALLAAFRAGTPAYGRLLDACDREEVVAKFRELEGLKRRNAVQYETLTGASRRLLELACLSEPVRLRSRPGPFDWLAALRGRRLIAFDGGGVRSREVKRTLFLLVSMQVIHAVRRHFSETRRPLGVVLVLEEAGALGLVTPFVLAALQELRKAGLAVHLVTQSSLDFGDRGQFEAVLANTPWQAWYRCLAPADQELGGRALANPTFSPLAVHFTRPRTLRDGRGERTVTDAYYKSPGLHAQEYSTRLATLRVGERLVLDRGRVRLERLRRVRTSLPFRVTEERTRAAIARVRQQPVYLPPAEPEPVPPQRSTPGAAERLRLRSCSRNVGDGTA